MEPQLEIFGCTCRIIIDSLQPRNEWYDINGAVSYLIRQKSNCDREGVVVYAFHWLCTLLANGIGQPGVDKKWGQIARRNICMGR